MKEGVETLHEGDARKDRLGEEAQMAEEDDDERPVEEQPAGPEKAVGAINQLLSTLSVRFGHS